MQELQQSQERKADLFWNHLFNTLVFAFFAKKRDRERGGGRGDRERERERERERGKEKRRKKKKKKEGRRRRRRRKAGEMIYNNQTNQPRNKQTH